MKEKLVINKDSKLFPLITALFAVSLGASALSSFLMLAGSSISIDGKFEWSAPQLAGILLLSGASFALVISCIRPARKGLWYLIALAFGWVRALASCIESYILTSRYVGDSARYRLLLNVVPLVIELAVILIFALTVFGVIKKRTPALVMFAIELGRSVLMLVLNTVFTLGMNNILINGEGGALYIAGTLISCLGLASSVAYLLLMFTFKKEEE